MRTGEVCRVFENMALREAGGGLIRPGGLELTQRAVALGALGSGSTVLDVGCGTGVAVHHLIESGFRAVGIDSSILLLTDGGPKCPSLPLAGASGSELPFAGAAFDAVLAECSLSVMEDVGKALDECSRVLKKQGILLIHDVYARIPGGGEALRGLPVRCCLTGAVSREEWIGRLEERGFAVNLWEDHSHTLKELAARLIFQQGSLDAFWGRSKIGDGRKIQCAVSSAKPGYFLAVAKKEA